MTLTTNTPPDQAQRRTVKVQVTLEVNNYAWEGMLYPGVGDDPPVTYGDLLPAYVDGALSLMLRADTEAWETVQRMAKLEGAVVAVEVIESTTLHD